MEHRVTEGEGEEEEKREGVGKMDGVTLIMGVRVRAAEAVGFSVTTVEGVAAGDMVDTKEADCAADCDFACDFVAIDDGDGRDVPVAQGDGGTRTNKDPPCSAKYTFPVTLSITVAAGELK